MAKPRGLSSRTNKDGKQVWYVRVLLNGRQQHFGSFPSQRAAQEFYDRAKYLRREQKITPGKTSHVEYTVPEMFAAYLPQAQHRRAYREQQRFAAWWTAYWPHQRVFDLTPQHIEVAKVALRTSGRRGARRENTVARHIECLKHVMRTMVQPRSWVVDLWSQITMDKPHRIPPRPLTIEDQRLLFTQLTPDDQDRVSLAIMTGLRRGQLFGIRWETIDWAHNGVHLPTFKRQHPRFLPVPTDAMAILRRRWRTAGQPTTGWLFPQLADPTKHEDPDAWYKHHFRRAVTAAGLAGKHITFHSTRHTFAVRFLEGGGHVRALQKAGDWSDLKLVEMYTHMHDEQLRTAMERGARLSPERSISRKLQKQDPSLLKKTS